MSFFFFFEEKNLYELTEKVLKTVHNGTNLMKKSSE